jgi:hypothetical protein
VPILNRRANADASIHSSVRRVLPVTVTSAPAKLSVKLLDRSRVIARRSGRLKAASATQALALRG